MNEHARACAAYFQSRPGYRRILSQLLKKYQSYGRPAGTIRLDDATREECDEASLAVPSPRRYGSRRHSLRLPFRSSVLGNSP